MACLDRQKSIWKLNDLSSACCGLEQTGQSHHSEKGLEPVVGCSVALSVTTWTSSRGGKSWLSASRLFISSSFSWRAAASNSSSGNSSRAFVVSSLGEKKLSGGRLEPKKSIPGFFVLTRLVHLSPMSRIFTPALSLLSFASIGSAYA